jgi:phage repressor protein C with HTH and peptisase S24 domain
MFGLYIIRVVGNSMKPIFRDGDFAIVCKYRRPKIKDVVLVRHPEYGLIVKRLIHQDQSDNAAYLAGDNPLTISSYHMGKLSSDAIIGVVYICISKTIISRV